MTDALSNDRKDERDVGAAEALHDISNALTVIVGWLDAATRDPAIAARAIGIAGRKAREARGLAREAIGAPMDEDRPERIDYLAGLAVEALAIEAAQKGVTLALEGSETVAADAALVARGGSVAQILDNLLVNAIAFSPRGGTVRVKLARGQGRTIEVAVEDEGPGVSAEVLPRLFEGVSTRKGGAGIGLRHAREVARRLGGDLVHRASGKGASFVLVAPRVAASIPPPPPVSVRAEVPAIAPPTRVSLQGARILVLEDDRQVCALLDAGLGARGAEVIAVHDGATFSAQLASVGRVDAVLLDLSPIASDVDGAVAAVRANLPNAGIVVISGSAIAIESAALSEAAGRTRWVRKPFEVAEISDAIASLLAR